MLKLWHRSTAPDPHKEVFLTRYEQILTWALKLTDNRRQRAEDLVQDAFVYLVNSKPDLDKVRNLDAYLYVVLRNLHRAQIQKALRHAAVPLSIIDCDS